MRLRVARKVCLNAVLWRSWYWAIVLCNDPRRYRGSTVKRAVRRAMKAKRNTTNVTD